MELADNIEQDIQNFWADGKPHALREAAHLAAKYPRGLFVRGLMQACIYNNLKELPGETGTARTFIYVGSSRWPAKISDSILSVRVCGSLDRPGWKCPHCGEDNEISRRVVDTEYEMRVTRSRCTRCRKYTRLVGMKELKRNEAMAS